MPKKRLIRRRLFRGPDVRILRRRIGQLFLSAAGWAIAQANYEPAKPRRPLTWCAGIEKVRNSRDKLGWCEGLGQKDAIRDAMGGPLIGACAGSARRSPFGEVVDQVRAGDRLRLGATVAFELGPDSSEGGTARSFLLSLSRAT